MMQGFGKLNGRFIETPAQIRYGQLTNDEYFVSEAAAKQGVVIEKLSSTNPIVMLKHFGSPLTGSRSSHECQNNNRIR